MAFSRVSPFVLIVALQALPGCALAPPVYWAEPIRGRVVDADSGEPISGAVVIADWKLYCGGIGHGGHRDSLLVQSTLTDVNGEFSFEKWGPKKRPGSGVLDNAPHIVVFKSSYDYENLWNESDSNWFVRRSDWDGKTVALKRSSRPAESRLMSLDSLLMIEPAPQSLLEEILKEEPLHHPWPADGPTFFRHVRELILKRKSEEKTS
jgi:hypothetical protein